MKRSCLIIFLSFVVHTLNVCCAQTVDIPRNESPPIHVPLVMSKLASGAYKARIDVGIGSLQPIPFTFDTGSTGLHMFANPAFEGAGSGIRFSQIPTSVIYGNPPRVIFSGVICYATLHIGIATTTSPIAIPYLTKESSPPKLPDGKVPDIHNPKSFLGESDYGIFGSGITGVVSGKNNPPP